MHLIPVICGKIVRSFIGLIIFTVIIFLPTAELKRGGIPINVKGVYIIQSLFLLLFFLFISFFYVFLLQGVNNHRVEMNNFADNELNHAQFMIDRQVNLYSNLAISLASHTTIRQMFDKEISEASDAWRIIEGYRNFLGIHAVYLIDVDGSIINNEDGAAIENSAAVNLRRVAAGNIDVYPIVDPDSGKRSFYYKAPVLNENSELVGLIIIKHNLDSLSQNLFLEERIFLLSENDIVFFGGDDRYDYKALFDLRPEDARRLNFSPQFGYKQIEILGFKNAGDDRLYIGPDGKMYLINKKPVAIKGWHIAVIEEHRHLDIMIFNKIKSALKWLLIFLISYFYVLSYSLNHIKYKIS